MKSLSSGTNNWLGFSLSSQMNMEVSCADQQEHHQPQHNSLFLSPSQLNNSTMSYGFLYSELPVMPLKSDGSLCIMEALNRSQQQGMVPSLSPKLEDFLGGGNNEGETIQSSYFQPLQEEICSQLAGHEMYQSPLEEEAISSDNGLSSLKNWLVRNYNVMGGEEAGSGGSVGAIGYADLYSLSLSMSPGSQSRCVTVPQHNMSSSGGFDSMALEGSKKRAAGKELQKQTLHRKSIDTFGQRTSQYRGVTRHRWTGRYEAHLWDNSCKKEGQTRKGRQVYLGGYDMEEKAARAYDLAALKYWGPSTHINFSADNYHEELEEMKNMTRQEYVAHLRRKSSGFSRGASMYRGVTRHHQHGRWQARIGRVAGNKDLYLGTFSTQEEAAEAYDIAAIKFRGANAVTNFNITRYDVDKIIASNTLLSGELARKNKAISGGSIDPPPFQNSEDGRSCSGWKVALYQSSQHNVSFSDSLNEKPMHDGFFGMETVGLSDYTTDDSVKPGSLHPSNTSSLVTSLSSSREGSPDGADLSMLYSKAPSRLISPITPWPAVPVASMPMFAAWSDV